MALYPQTGSSLGAAGGQNNTNVALSTQILVKVGNFPVGAIQELSITEARTIAMVNELGTDGSVDSAPNGSTKISGNCRRIRFDRMRAAEAFGRDFIHLHSQRIPFDITIYDQWQGDGTSTIITTIKNVWMSNIQTTYSATDWIVMDQFQWEAEAIYTTLNGGPAARGRGPGSIQLNPVERDADQGKRRGSLDAVGLITDFFPGV